MGQVFHFTWQQNTKGKGFFFSTFLFPVILCVLCIVVNLATAVWGSSEEETSAVEKVYVENHTKLGYLDFSDFCKYAGAKYEQLEFELTGHATEQEPFALDVTLEETEEEYAMTVHLPEWSTLSKQEVEEFNDGMAGYVEQLSAVDAIKHSGKTNASEAEILAALMPVQQEEMTMGDAWAGLGAELMKEFLPMLLVFLLYMMVLLYGQAIGKIVISEKVSKLMETLLVTVKPYQLISGKILAMIAIAVMQICLWILGLAAGLWLGNFFAKEVNPNYSNVIFEAVKLIQELGAGLAFSTAAVIFSILAFVMGFIFYCVLAGLFATPVSKAEELASSTTLFQTFVVIAFLAAYMLPSQGIDSKAIEMLLHLLPFTSAFMLSGDILVGNVELLPGAGYLLLLVIITIGIAIYTGKLYKNQVFYNNASGSFFKRLFR